jgi:ribosomal protein L4
MPDVEVVGAKDVNVYQLLRYPVVVISRDAMPRIETRLEGKAKGAG